MKLKIDNREKQLIKLIVALQNMYEFNYEIIIENLPLGDVIICADDDTELLLIERKSLSDLAASIRDGRYAEQSFRLHHLPHHNHNIMYLIEGNMNNYSNRYTRIEPKALYSAMFTMQYYKGFSVTRTFDIQETAEYILRITDKLHREKNKQGFYNGGVTEPKEKTYSNVVKRVKKQNLTPSNIGEVILSQIPGISSTTSMAIMTHFGSLYKLMLALNEDRNCMNNMTYTTKNGQQRRISNKSIENIVNYLLYQRENVITIKTEGGIM